MGKSLVIVESPAKARTIAALLGDEYVVESSIGHIRDLPRRASDVPKKYKKLPWARLGVDVENDFRPLYVLNPEKRAQIGKLKKLISQSNSVLLATDEDREGESIAWHLAEVLDPKVPMKRMVFHEITPSAIARAIREPRDIDRRLVNAQEARRILDRLYGYEVSPVLWKKIMPRLSAGRVQSVATRMIVRREHQRISAVAVSYWSVQGTFRAAGGELTASLLSVDDRRLATGKDFALDGTLKHDSLLVLDEARATALVTALAGMAFAVRSRETKPYRRSPAPPFMTSTLQQEAGRKLRFSAARTMRAAQRLYEGGFITYMRTDSTNLAETALQAARKRIAALYGAEYLPAEPRRYRRKVKNAQEAHEAIRPAGEQFHTPQQVATQVPPDEAKIYELVWKRTLASQMQDARGERLSLRIAGRSAEGEQTVFAATGNTIQFPGFLRAYVEGSDDPDAELDNRERHLPAVEQGEALTPRGFAPDGHQTQPPARYTEASLVRRLEELGVGRPSTYAAIIHTIVERGYVWKKGAALVPSFKAFAVVNLLEKHFADLVDYEFTARMEDDLDRIAAGEKQSLPWLRRFYFGAGDDQGSVNGSAKNRPGLKAMVVAKLDEIDAREINTVPIGVDEHGTAVAVRVGRYGPYLQRGDDTMSLPDDLPPDELNLEKALELLSKPGSDREIGIDPDTGLMVLLRQGRFGVYVQLGPARARDGKPRTQSVMPSMDPGTLTLAQALSLLSLPRTIGQDDTGVPITAHFGRYGGYVARGSDRRSVERDADVFDLDRAGALALLAQPRRPARQRAKRQPLRQLGDDPVSGKPIVLLEGRYGHYVTDGETNATLRTGDSPAAITEQRAQELLQLRRDRGPSRRSRAGSKSRTGKKAATKKAATKKAATKKAVTKKAVTKKAVTKKAVTKKAATKKPRRKKAATKKAAVTRNSAD